MSNCRTQTSHDKSDFEPAKVLHYEEMQIGGSIIM